MKPDWKPIDSAPKDTSEFFAVWERNDGTCFIALTNYAWHCFTQETIFSFVCHTRLGKEMSFDGFAKPIKWDYLPDMEV
jgi:hypothetical protein